MTSDRRHSRDNSDTVSGTNSANTFPSGYGQNTEISNPEVSTLSEAAKSIRIEDFKKIHKYPCARDAFLTRIGGGFGIGGLRAMFGGMVLC
jgi:cytochrome c oxidase assembly protein subunit 20